MSPEENYDSVLSTIETLGLKPATKRDLSLMSVGCLARGYTTHLRKVLGFSYEALGGIGSDGTCSLLLDEAGVIDRTTAYIEQNISEIEARAFKPARELFQRFSQDLKV